MYILLGLLPSFPPLLGAEEGFCMMCTMEVHIEDVLSCSGSAIAPTAVVNELPRESFQMVSFGGIFHF